jgi:ribosomal protein S18 acetylase RimI-like enzyme
LATIEPLYRLDAEGETLLRVRAVYSGRNGDRSIDHVRDALALGKLTAVALYDERRIMRGISAWKWQDVGRTRAQVVMLYVEPAVSRDTGALLGEHVFRALSGVPTLEVIAARARDDSPGVWNAFLKHGALFFERCRMQRRLGDVPLPVVAPPNGYRITPWNDDYGLALEQVAAAAHEDDLEAVVVPHNHVARTLHRLRTGDLLDQWNTATTLVAVNRDGQPVGHVVISAVEDGAGRLVDLAVHPRHRRQGLGRALMVRGLQACRAQGITTLTAGVTTRNPARRLFDHLGFSAVDCGRVAIWWRDGRQQACRE